MRVGALRRFARHYVEMVLVMVVGMMVLHPVWMLATAGASEAGVLRSVEVESLVMATTMAAPMAAWMRFRGHRGRPTVEMGVAMYAGFVVMFPPHWSGALGAGAVMVLGHVAMLVLMLVAMWWRRQEYLGHDHGAAPTPEAGATIGPS